MVFFVCVEAISFCIRHLYSMLVIRNSLRMELFVLWSQRV